MSPPPTPRAAPSSSAKGQKKDLSAHVGSCVRVLVSVDPYLRKEATDEWLRRWQSDGPSSLARVDLSEQSLTQVIASAQSSSLFAPRQAIVADRFDSIAAKDQGPLLHYLQTVNPQTLLLLTADKLDGRQKLSQTLQKAGCVDVLMPPAAHELPSFIERRARAQGIALASGTAAILAERVGPDVGLLQGSLEKLALSVAVLEDPQHSRAITPEDVIALVVPTREASIFVLTEALGEGPHEKASRALHDLLQGGEEPLVILAMLIRQVRLLLAAKTSERVVGVPPFVARQLTRQAERLDVAILHQALGLLQACDLSLKRSTLPPALAIERAMWPLLQAATQSRRTA